jgi:hypothetical protein
MSKNNNFNKILVVFCEVSSRPAVDFGITTTYLCKDNNWMVHNEEISHGTTFEFGDQNGKHD